MEPSRSSQRGTRGAQSRSEHAGAKCPCLPCFGNRSDKQESSGPTSGRQTPEGHTPGSPNVGRPGSSQEERTSTRSRQSSSDVVRDLARQDLRPPLERTRPWRPAPPGEKSSRTSPQENMAFAQAFETHLLRLSENERKRFLTFAYRPMNELLEDIQILDEQQGSSFHRRGLKLVDEFSRLVGPLTATADGVLSAIEPIAVPLAVIKTVLHLVVRASESHEQFTVTVRHLVELLRIVDTYACMENVDPPILRVLEKIYGGFLAFCQEAMPYYATEAVTRKKIGFIWQTFQDRFGTIVAELDCDLKRLSMTAEQVTYQRVDNLEYQGFLRELGISNIEEYRCRLDPREEGTCSWITQENNFGTWLHTSSQIVLTLFGNTGTGKTTLMNYITEYFELLEARGTEPAIPCSFFFDQNVHNQRTALDAIKSLICQLLQRHRPFATLFRRNLTHHGHAVYNSVPRLFSILEEMLQGITSYTIYIIVDALDKCESKSLRDFLLHTTRIARNCENVKFAYSSRPHQYITSRLPQSRMTINLYTMMKGDIQLITKRRVKALARTNNYDQGTQSLVENAIITKAGDCVLWVDLVIRALESTHSNNNSLLLQQINEVPQELNDVYRQILNRIEAANRKIAARALTTIMYAFRPLSLMELAAAVIVDQRICRPADIKAAFEPCRIRYILGPLVRLSEGIIELSHHSLRGYLASLSAISDYRSPHRSHPCEVNLMEQLMAETLSHDALAEACIRYLSWSYLDDDKGLANTNKLAVKSAPSLTEGHLRLVASKRYLAQESLPRSSSQNLELSSSSKSSDPALSMQAFFTYAARYWPFHYSLASEAVATSLQSHVMFLIGHTHPSKDKIAESVLSKWTEEYRDFRKPSSTSNFPSSTELNPFVLAAYFDFTSVLMIPLKQHLKNLTHTLEDACRWAAKMGHLKAMKDILDWSESLNENVTKLSTVTSAGAAKDIEILSEENISKKKPREEKIFSARSKSSTSEYDWVRIIANLLPSRDDFAEQHHRLLKGDTPARISKVRKAKLDMFKILVKKSWFLFDITQRDKKGRTILSYIAESGDTEMLQILLQLSSPPDRESLLSDKGDNANLTPVWWALAPSKDFGPLNDAVGVVKILCRESDADIQLEGKDLKGRTAIAVASVKGLAPLVEYLAYSKPAVVDIPDDEGRTPLSLAAEHDDGFKVAGVLIKTGKVDVESESANGFTPLQHSIQKGNLTLTRVLVIEGGADIRKAIKVNLDGTLQLTMKVPAGSEKSFLERIEDLARELGINIRDTGPHLRLSSSGPSGPPIPVDTQPSGSQWMPRTGGPSLPSTESFLRSDLSNLSLTTSMSLRRRLGGMPIAGGQYSSSEPGGPRRLEDTQPPRSQLRSRSGGPSLPSTESFLRSTSSELSPSTPMDPRRRQGARVGRQT